MLKCNNRFIPAHDSPKERRKGIVAGRLVGEAPQNVPTENLEAYQVYLRGLDARWGPDRAQDDLRFAIEMIERAVELDPEFTKAHTELSMAHSWVYFSGFDPAEGR